MSGNRVTIIYEQPTPDEFVKEEVMLYHDYGNTGDISSNQLVNAVNELAVKQEHEGEPAALKIKEEVKEELMLHDDDGNERNISSNKPQEDCEIKPFEAIFLNEEDYIGFSDCRDSDPLAIKEKNGIANPVGFEIKKEDRVLLDNEDAVSQVDNGNAHPSSSKNRSHPKLQVSIVCGSSKEKELHSAASHVISVRDNHEYENSRLSLIDESNPKKPTTCDKAFQCSHCDYKCARKGKLTRHMLTHTGVKRFQCCHCDFKCTRKGQLNFHMLTHTGVKPFQCPQCDYKCTRKGQLKVHMLTHTGVKPFQCSHCNYKCTQNGHLRVHMLIHTGVIPYQCPQCEYKCKEKGRLKAHMLTHTGVKQFQCCHCDYKCLRKGQLKAHMLTHTGVKPFQCSHCDYKSAYKNHLKEHILTHTGVKPFQCTHCDFKCTRKGNLKRHALTHSGVKPI